MRNTALSSAEVIVPLLINTLSPRSVVDVGCGEGAWLSVFARAGIGRILGFDGDHVDGERLLIPRNCFVARDLSEPFVVDEPFDLAVSLEVGEHLPESVAKSFTASLARLAPVVLFSAAIPGQGGTNHVNEQWPLFWAKQFADSDFDCFDVLRQSIWDNDQVAWWYRQNVLLFARRGSSAWLTLSRTSKPGTPSSLIHPILWINTHGEFSRLYSLSSNPDLRLSFVHIVRALRRRLLKMITSKREQI